MRCRSSSPDSTPSPPLPESGPFRRQKSDPGPWFLTQERQFGGLCGAGGAGEESGFFDRDPRDASSGDEPGAVLHRHAEREPSAFDCFEDRLRRDRLAHSDGREVVELHSVTDRRVTSWHVAVDRGNGRPFGQQDHVRGGEHRHRTRALGERGIGVDDGMSQGSGKTGVERHGRTIRNPQTDSTIGR